MIRTQFEILEVLNNLRVDFRESMYTKTLIHEIRSLIQHECCRENMEMTLPDSCFQYSPSPDMMTITLSNDSIGEDIIDILRGYDVECDGCFYNSKQTYIVNVYNVYEDFIPVFKIQQ